MTSIRRFVFAAVVAVLGAACATSVAPETGGGSAGDGDGKGGDSGTPPNVSYAGDDGGTSPTDGGAVHTPPKDSGTITPPTDSGTLPPPVDSGTTSTATFCVGQTSTYENEFETFKYDDWCDENVSHDNKSGTAFECTTNSDCDGIFSVTACCYKPKSGGYCQSDYGSVPQCVPQ